MIYGKYNKSVLEEIPPPCTLEVLMIEQKLSFFGYIMRAENECLEKSTMLGTVEGKRGRGRRCMC